MLIVGLTGGIGAGKSTVANMFAQLGALTIDADQLARQAIEKGSPGFNEVISTFGEEILSDGEIDRQRLGSIVFKDSSKRKELESIIHPRVQEALAQKIKSLSPGDILIYEIPLLVETGAAGKFDYIITVEVLQKDGSKKSYTVWLNDKARYDAVKVGDNFDVGPYLVR
jgi:dephospho-CoA kinase